MPLLDENEVVLDEVEANANTMDENTNVQAERLVSMPVTDWDGYYTVMVDLAQAAGIHLPANRR